MTTINQLRITEEKWYDNIIQIHNRKDLEKYGIGYLTSERCPFYRRGLYDLTELGKRIVENFLDVQCTSRNWNSKVLDKNAIASVMLPHDTIESLMVFILATIEKSEAIASFHGVILGFPTIEIYERYKREYKPSKENFKHIWKTSLSMNSNGNCTHGFSGRL